MVNFSLFVQCLVKYALTYWDLHVCGHVCARQNLLTDKFPSISHTLIASWLMKYAAYCSCSRANLQSLRLLRVCFCACTLAGYTWRMFSLFGFDTDSLLFDFWSIQHTFKATEQICSNYTVSCACICALMQDIVGDKFCGFCTKPLDFWNILHALCATKKILWQFPQVHLPSCTSPLVHLPFYISPDSELCYGVVAKGLF